MAAPVPAPSFVITRTEEWPEADFDLTDDQESFSIDNEGETETDAGDLSSRLKGSRPSLSGAGAVAKLGGAPVEDEDWDAEFEDPPPKRHGESVAQDPGPPDLDAITSAQVIYRDTSSLMSMYPPDASPSVSSSSQPGTETDPSEGDFGIYEDDEDEAFDGLVLPEGLAGKALAKHLEIKKKVVPAKIAAEQSAKGANISRSHKAPNEAEDFESGLLIGDDEDFSPSRLRTRREAIDTPRSKSVPVPRSASIVKPHLRTESVIEVLASASNPSITRSRSPNSSSRGSLSRKDSRSSLVSPTFSSLRPSALRASSSTLPHSSTLSLLTIPGTPIVPSSISPRPVPLKHQKSVGRLQLSSPAGSGLGAQRLPRKASLSSLADASATVATSSGTPSTSSTVSARSSGFSAPTAASKARHKPEGREQAEAERKRSYPVPPTRPTTPSSNPVALRLTMPTSNPPKNPGMQSLRHKPRVDFPPKVPVSVPVPEPAPRRRKPVVTPLNGPRKKPMLIRNLGGVGAAKTVGDMKWNPKTLRWEGNEQVLKEFDSHLPSSRPALITHFTGSTLGGIASPTGSFLASGARIVGNMMFDPVRMCWISRLPPEEDEPDVFAGLADEGDEWEDKAGTIRANVGLAGSTDDVQDWKGSVRSTNSDRAMTMSPTRSYTKSMSESGSEAGDPPPRGFDSRRSVRGSFGGLSVYEEVPGVDDSLVAACRAAEERHRQEMKGWNVRSRARSRSIKSSTETEEELGRTHLFDIRALATRKY
ncbi:hypothetical protein FRC07_011223 [Ceratobasidium sp. 392]|nr:hypothetical protein FRC07_011223 [Ceratobasidium sp. 392]